VVEYVSDIAEIVLNLNIINIYHDFSEDTLFSSLNGTPLEMGCEHYWRTLGYGVSWEVYLFRHITIVY
jgi:hypothetical protein